MQTRRLNLGLTVLALVMVSAAYSLVLLKSTQLSVVLFTISYIVLIMVVEPFLGLLLLITFTYWPPQDYIPGLMAARVMLLTSLGTFVSMVVRKAVGRQSVVFVGSPQDYLVLWLYASFSASYLAQMDVSSAGQAAWSLSYLPVLFFLITNLVTSERRLSIVLRVLLLCTLGLAVQAIAQIGFEGKLLAASAGDIERAMGVGHFANPNMLAIALVCMMPYAYLMLVRSNGLLKRCGWVLVLGCLSAGLYVTNSRGGVLSMGVVAVFLLIRRYGIGRGIMFGVALFVAIFLVGPSRMTTISASEPSAYQRMLAWKEGLETFYRHALFGIGAGAWVAKYGSIVPHNSLIHCAAELGLFGLLPWVLLIYTSLRHAAYVGKSGAVEGHEQLAVVAEALLLGLSGFALASLFISKTYHPLLFILVALCASATRILVNSSDRTYQLLETKDVICGVLIATGGLVVFKLFLLVVGV